MKIQKGMETMFCWFYKDTNQIKIWLFKPVGNIIYLEFLKKNQAKLIDFPVNVKITEKS